MGDASGIGDLEQAIEIAAAAHSYEEVGAAANLAWMTVLLGDLRRAGELHEQTRNLSRRLGVLGFIRWQEAEHVFHCHWEGRWDEALEASDEYFRQIEPTAGHYMEGACRCILSAIYLARGQVDRALAEARQATELSRPIKDSQTLNPALAFHSRTALAAGERAEADAIADELVEIWSASGIRQPHELSVAPWTFRELARSEQVLEAIDAEAGHIGPWHEAARQIASDDLPGAAESFERIGSVPDEAYARLKAAEALVAVGNRAEADRQLRLALPVFARLGASAWTAEAESLLAESA
jgi:tetratricopeptide (TPR) repeat protein